MKFVNMIGFSCMLLFAACCVIFAMSFLACGSNPADPQPQGNTCYRISTIDGGELEEYFYLLNSGEFVHVYDPVLDAEIFVQIEPGNEFRLGCMPTEQNTGTIRIEVLIDGVSFDTQYCTEHEYYNIIGIVPEE